jgi:hypothetical protein
MLTSWPDQTGCSRATSRATASLWQGRQAYDPCKGRGAKKGGRQSKSSSGGLDFTCSPNPRNPKNPRWPQLGLLWGALACFSATAAVPVHSTHCKCVDVPSLLVSRCTTYTVSGRSNVPAGGGYRGGSRGANTCIIHLNYHLQ